jgi:16S rRNA (uracil1498-N3)-methyltransferase
MTIHRFYLPHSDLTSSTLIVDDKDILFQWRNVLRLTSGRRVELFDGTGIAAIYVLDDISLYSARLSQESQFPALLPKRQVTLCFALLKKDKTEWVIQKATEVGVSRLMPVITARTEKTGFDRVRAERIAREAAEQCGRGDVPTIAEPMPLSTITITDKEHAFLLDRGAPPLASLIPRSPEPVTLFIGPEGGWTDEERTDLITRGAQKAAISDFTLRAETASVAAVLGAIPTAHAS